MNPLPTWRAGHDLVVRAHQLAPRLGRVENNLAVIARAIQDAVVAGADVLVLPELATSGYYFESVEEARSAALLASDPVFGRWQAMLGPETVVVVGFAERVESSDLLYNSAVILTRGGTPTVYRKTHLWGPEKSIFEPGDAEAPVIDTPAGRIGVLICYDLEFPEMARAAALREADLIVVPTNWPLVERPRGEHAPEVIQAMAAARASRIAVICCDRSGTERGHEWTAGTSIVSSEGWVVASTAASTGRSWVQATLRIDGSRRQIGPVNNVRDDRRPALYGTLTRPNGSRDELTTSFTIS